jgi:hypothetical protein
MSALEEKLKQLKELYDSNFIPEPEYNERRKALIEEFGGSFPAAVHLIAIIWFLNFCPNPIICLMGTF